MTDGADHWALRHSSSRVPSGPAPCRWPSLSHIWLLGRRSGAAMCPQVYPDSGLRAPRPPGPLPPSPAVVAGSFRSPRHGPLLFPPSLPPVSPFISLRPSTHPFNRSCFRPPLLPRGLSISAPCYSSGHPSVICPSLRPCTHVFLLHPVVHPPVTHHSISPPLVRLHPTRTGGAQCPRLEWRS